MAFPNHIEITIPRDNTGLNHDNIRIVPEIEAFDLSLSAQLLQAAGSLSNASSQLEVVIAHMKREGSANPSRPAVEAVITQMRREGSGYPFRPALEATLAFALGAFAPILVAAYITEYTVRLAVVIVASTTVALTAIGSLGAVLGRSRLVSSCVRVLVGGWMAMAVTACFTKLLAVN
ncbi:vacuolar iron transporter homolog 4-like [Salvia splendens]|uniref:vacuolar iron transporter homolog 4-like n=1 Tax=Salvia splendens TaxID=180675 RepID=UPI001C27E8BD|nr:vacuolar iron transporter homolog 4-like [Salvia splendens]